MEDIIPITWEENRSIIKVIGVGGGGSNAVNHMFRTEIKDVCFMVCNTDAQSLAHSPVSEKLQLGEMLTRGRGAGCDPELARKAAVESKEKIAQLLSGTTEMVFIIAGMGGGTGTGAAPVIAEVARKMGMLTVGVVTLPFRDEGIDFLKRAIDGIHEMQKHADSLLIIDNEKLYKVFGDLSIFDAFPKADDVLGTAVKGIAEIITRHGFINVDFADVKKVMKDSGMALMGSGSASGEGRAIRAVEEAFSSPLLNDVDLGSASSVLVNITSGKEKGLSMAELAQIMDCIKEYTGGVSSFKRGVVCDPAMGDAISVTIVATGLNMSSLPHIYTLSKEEPMEFVELRETPFPTLDTDETPGLQVSSGPFQTGNGDCLFRVQSPVQPSVGVLKPITVKKGKPSLILEPGEKIADFENVPAYIRQRIKIQDDSVSEVKVSSIKMEERDGRQHLSSNNSYIHQTQD
ncbi:MAG: cell division protein FtsZ [Bacteroidales bacterium]|nr:cell division protein FtsZ [Bacteroidales bacterium]